MYIGHGGTTAYSAVSTWTYKGHRSITYEEEQYGEGAEYTKGYTERLYSKSDDKGDDLYSRAFRSEMRISPKCHLQ